MTVLLALRAGTPVKDPGARDRNLKILQGMTSPQVRIFGDLRNGDKARIYWLQQWPAALDNRCGDTMRTMTA